MASLRRSVAAASPRQEVPEIVKAFYADVNASEIDKAMRYVATEAVFINPIGQYRGRAAIRKFLERGASEGIVFHHTNFRVHGYASTVG